MTPTLIGLDWGTSSLRGYLMSADGTVIEQRSAGKGIMQVEGERFADALSALCGDWLTAHPAATLIACGMIGSRQGWIEAPYCPCPANATALAGRMARIDIGNGRMLHIVPGVSCVDPESGVPDVMRGEETQIIGAVSAEGARLAVLPGTHSKWVWVEDGAIRRFSTWMTGEVYAALTQHTILGRLMQKDAPHDAGAFARGTRYGFENPARLLARIFSARTLGLFGEIGSAALPSYLSGLLIGAEIGAACGERTLLPALLLGDHSLTQRYQLAFDLTGMDAAPGPADCAALGLHRLDAARQCSARQSAGGSP